MVYVYVAGQQHVDVGVATAMLALAISEEVVDVVLLVLDPHMDVELISMADTTKSP